MRIFGEKLSSLKKQFMFQRFLARKSGAIKISLFQHQWQDELKSVIVVLVISLTGFLLITSCSIDVPSPTQSVVKTPRSSPMPVPTKTNAPSPIAIDRLLTATPQGILDKDVSSPSLLLSTPTKTYAPPPATPTDIHGLPTPALGGVPIEKIEEKLSFRLQLLADPAIRELDTEEQAQKLSLPVDGPGSLIRNKQGELLVYIGLMDLSETNLKELTEAGANILHISEEYGIVTAYIDPALLYKIAALSIVKGIQEELRP